MDSWAATDTSYPSQYADTPNKAAPPDEMQAVGWVPTYIDAAGNLVTGDALTAQHINFILNDLYSKYSAALARIEQLQGGEK